MIESIPIVNSPIPQLISPCEFHILESVWGKASCGHLWSRIRSSPRHLMAKMQCLHNSVSLDSRSGKTHRGSRSITLHGMIEQEESIIALSMGVCVVYRRNSCISCEASCVSITYTTFVPWFLATPDSVIAGRLVASARYLSNLLAWRVPEYSSVHHTALGLIGILFWHSWFCHKSRSHSSEWSREPKDVWGSQTFLC